MNNENPKQRRIRRQHVTIALLVLSLVLMVLTPYDTLIEKFDARGLVTLLVLLVISESMFIGGIVLMAVAVGHDIGKNPLRWRHHLKTLIKRVVADKLFWGGFWINATGALLTGLFIAFGVITYLPVQSWGLLWIAGVDIAITIALRYEIYKLTQSEAE